MAADRAIRQPPPIIQFVKPNPAVAGSDITVTGTGMPNCIECHFLRPDGSQGEIDIVDQSFSNQLIATIPVSEPGGAGQIQMLDGWQQLSNLVPMTIAEANPPVVQSLLPRPHVLDTELTINGLYLDDVQAVSVDTGTDVVSISGFESRSDTAIVVIIPAADLSAGSVMVSVVDSMGRQSNAMVLQLLAEVPVPLPPVGDGDWPTQTYPQARCANCGNIDSVAGLNAFGCLRCGRFTDYNGNLLPAEPQFEQVGDSPWRGND